MFERVLIANRGEIAVRIERTLARLGVESVAIFSDADAGAPHVRAADRAVHVGPTPALESYLSIERVVDAAVRSGADAVHPGYGFLSERPDFAAACAAAGLVFVGPGPEAMALLGDKGRARAVAAEAGMPTLPGWSGEERSDAEIVEAVGEGDLPLLVKAAAGGGGKGMRLVARREDLAEALGAARREAASAFGDERLIIERYVEPSRHLEVQVIADAHGNAIHLGERECSLQRRHQKVIEESPSPVVSAELRERMGEAAVALARHAGYVNAGTVELIAERDDPERFWFLEVNTRLQVEHPVTEAVTGPRPGRAAAAGGGGRAAAARPGRGAAPRLGGRGAPLRRGPGDRLPAVERRGRRLPRAAPACGSTAGSSAGRWSAPTTTRCWPRSSRRGTTGTRRWRGCAARSASWSWRARRRTPPTCAPCSPGPR